MKTSKGSTYKSLLAVKLEQGDLYLSLRVPMSLGDISQDYIDKMIPFLDERIRSEKPPAGILAKTLEQIDLHRKLLTDAYVNLFETYQRAISPKVRRSPIESAREEMLKSMDDKMLRQFAHMYIAEAAMDFVLPQERESLIEATLKGMREKE